MIVIVHHFSCSTYAEHFTWLDGVKIYFKSHTVTMLYLVQLRDFRGSFCSFYSWKLCSLASEIIKALLSHSLWVNRQNIL